MTRFTKMFAAVSGAVAIGLVGVSAFLTSPASTQASTYEVAQINPDQMTRNAPRDLPCNAKFRYDLLYLRRAGLCVDLVLIITSFWITARGRWEHRGRKV